MGRAARSSGTPGRPLAALAVIALLAALAFPFGPVRQPEVRYTWSATDGPAAIPLMPYQPLQLTAVTSCASARAAERQDLLSTVPPRPDPAADPLYGLRLSYEDGRLRVLSAGTDLGGAALPDGDCALRLTATPQRTELWLDGAVVLSHAGDVRPDVAGAFSDLPAGVTLALTTDTRFQTTISPVKAVLGALCLAALLGVLVLLGRADRAVAPRLRRCPRRWWRPRPVDAAVAALLGGWWLVGAVTVDDGYIAGIVRSRAGNGFVGNVYRWLNAPEAPFSWFYELYARWAAVSTATGWLRLPSVLLGLLCWLLLHRLLLPRLGPCGRRPATGWLAALAFGTWWIPFDLGLRPEPWVALGTLATFLVVERALATRRVRPLAVALLLAAATTAVTPAGLMAFAPLAVGTPRLARLVHGRSDLPRRSMLLALLAAPAAAVLLMVGDQSLAAVYEATRVRQLIGGGGPWYAEYQRYAALLEPDSFQGAIGRRAAVLVTFLAAAAGWLALRARPGRVGLAAGPARRLVLAFVLGTVALTASPTKWSQHFGDLAGLGPAVLTLGLVAAAGPALADRPRRRVAGFAAGTVVAALVLTGRNLWPSVSGWFTPSFSTKPVDVAGVPLATITLGLGGLTVVAVLGRAAGLRAGGAAGFPVPRRLPAPAPPLVALLAAVLALQVGSLARVALAHPDSYTPAADALAALGGQPCGLQPLLSVELRPGAGLLLPRPGFADEPVAAVRTVDIGGRPLPGIAIAGRQHTGWFVLDHDQLDPADDAARLPVVVTVSGVLRVADQLFVEFGDDTGQVLQRRRVAGPEPDDVAAGYPERDDRQLAPAGATAVRIAVEAPPAGPAPAATVSVPRVPRVPRLTPLVDVLPPGATAVLDWPVAFTFPCLVPAPLPRGTAGLPGWRVAPPGVGQDAGITYRPSFGGPFAGPRLLVTEQRMPTYLAGDPLREAAQLRRWTPVQPLREPVPDVVEREVSGWSYPGRARVPELDPPG